MLLFSSRSLDNRLREKPLTTEETDTLKIILEVRLDAYTLCLTKFKTTVA